MSLESSHSPGGFSFVGFLKYLAIGFVIASAVVAFAIFNARSGSRMAVPMRWIGLVLFTPALFWALIKPYKRNWSRGRFWVAIFGLLVAHLMIFTLVLLQYPQWRFIWFVPVFLLEAIPLTFVLDRLFEHRVHAKKSMGL